MRSLIWWGSLLERHRLVHLRATAKVILRWILKKLDEMARTH
jgi:hypothetical protein